MGSCYIHGMFVFLRKVIHVLIIPVTVILEMLLLSIISLLGHPTFGNEPTQTDRVQVLFLFLALLAVPYISTKIFGFTKSKKRK